MLDYLVPMLLLLLCAVALRKQENAYELLLEGGKEGLKLLFSLIPTLVMLLTAVSMLRSSGAIDTLGNLSKPVFSFLGIPPETAMLVLIRPISGSAALAVGADLMAAYGPGFSNWPYRSHHARLHGNDLLHHQHLFWGRRGTQNPLHHSGGVDRRFGGLLHGQPYRPALFRRIRPVIIKRSIPAATPSSKAQVLDRPRVGSGSSGVGVSAVSTRMPSTRSRWVFTP